MSNLSAIQEERKKIILGLELAYRRMIEFKKSKKTPLVVTRNGHIVEINPEDAPPSVTYKWH